MAVNGASISTCSTVVVQVSMIKANEFAGPSLLSFAGGASCGATGRQGPRRGSGAASARSAIGSTLVMENVGSELS